MIRAVCRRRGDRWELRLSGHAGSAPYGQDLICAAVTALVSTLGQYLLDLYEDGLLKERPLVQLGPGHGRLTAQGKASALATAFSMTCTGLKLLQASYPENLQVERRYKI
jgi:uncharacterized protein YsxB (DUF464 family)